MDEQRILVVDDYGPLLAAVQDILEMEGYTVLTATDGVEALRVMEESCPDLIVTDILMPKMDGYIFCETVRARPGWELVPIIFLTAKAEMEDVLKGEKLGVESYVIKPFDPDELLTVVRSALERAQANR